MQIFSHISVSAPIWLGLIPLAWLLFRRPRSAGWCRAAALTALALAAADITVFWRGNAPRRIELRLDDAAARDPADALAAAGAEVRTDEGAEIRVRCASDRVDVRLARAAHLLNRRGIRVFVLPSGRSSGPTGLLRLEHPPVCGAGETVPVAGTVAFPEPPRTAEFAVLDEAGNVLARTERQSVAGRTEFLLHTPLERPGMRRLRLQVDGREAAVFRVLVREPYRALLISKDPGEAAALRRISAGRVRLDLHPAQSDPASYPLYVIGAGGAGLLTASQLEKIASQVRSGAGLLLLCGRELPFDPEAVPRSFAELSPVRYSGRDLDRVPATALVIIIDTSGSMSGPRIALARETARLAVDRLRECDLAGVVEFHGRRRWAAPLQSAANQLELHRALNRLSAGGGTVLLPALREAFYALRNADTRLKHILILTDGGFERGDFASLLRRMAAYDITVSTVMTGPGRSDFLARLAVWGNGRHYNAANRFAIPELIFRQSGRETLPPYREGVFAVTVPDGSATAFGWPDGIRVYGVWESRLRQGAESLLCADRWPLLARRAEGAGHVAALNTELAGPWSRRLSGHPAFTGLLAALDRRLPDPVRLGRWDFRDRSRGKDAEFLIDAPGEIVELEAELSLPGGGREKFKLFREGGKPFRFRRNDLPPGEYELTVRSGDRAERIPFAVRTVRDVGAADIAAGINRRSEASAPPLPAWRSLRLRPFFGLLFILLTLTQLGLRRTAGAVTLLLAAVALPVFGDDFSHLVLRGMHSNSAKDYRAAAALARSPADRRLALLLWLDAVRDNAAEYRELLDRWKKAAAADPECLELLLDELEDRERGAEALELLQNTRFGGDNRFAGRLIRLAGKCGKTELIRRRAEAALAAAPCDRFRLQTAVRLELLAGDRQAAKRRLEAGIAAAATPEELAKLIPVAEESALYSAALDAADKLERLSADPWAAKFRKLEILRRQGEPGRAVAALKRWSEMPELPPGAVMKAADWCEQLGDSGTALRFYARLNDGEAVIRRAMLLQNLGRDAEALELWWQLAVAPGGGMRALQAMENCIALSGAAKNLPVLVRRVRRELTGNGSEALYRFYCRALAASGDEKTLFAFLSERELERMKLDSLLELKHYDAAAELIDRLRAQYPADSESLLRRKLLIAVENRDRASAEASVADLLAVSGDRIAALEYAAGTYSLLGDHAGALRFYDECLALAPDRIELYLLRAHAQKACGSGAAAIAFFRDLLTSETPADLFGVAVDGLLDLDAPASELRNALTAVLERLRREPEQLFYYQLADDLAEALGDAECRKRLLFRQLAVAPERRGLLLRQLFLAALAQSDRKAALRYAGLLLGLNEIYAPELYTALSRFLIENGRFATAERCVREADAAEDSADRLFDFVGTCLETGRLDDADRICRELLSLRPDSPELLTRYAAVKETGGDPSAAGMLNLAALKLLASRVAPGAVPERDPRNDPSRQLRPLIRAFAHQAVLFPEVFSAELARLSRAASPGARRMIWQPVRSRIRALRAFPAASAPPAKKAGTADPSELAVKLAVLPTEAAAAELFAVLDRMPPGRKNTFVPRLIGALSVSPSPAVEARLRREIGALELRDGKWDWPLISGAMPLKRLLAETFLHQYPESFHARILLARTRWAAGDAAGARRLAAVVFERFAELDSFNLPLIRAVRDLTPVFGAAAGEADGGAGARLHSEWIDELTRDEKLLGPRPARRILLAVLLDAAGEYDAALDLLSRMWREGERTVPVFRMMEILTLKTGRGDDFIRTLRAAPPKDAAVAVLYSRRLVQLLRESGRITEAREYLSALPEALRRSEQLLLDREESDPEKFGAALRRFLTEQSRGGGAVGVIDDGFGLGGLLGMRRRGEFRKNRLLSLSGGIRDFSEVLDHLLRGIPVTEPGFAVIFTARCQLAAPSHISEAVTPAEIALKSAAGEALSPEESRQAAALAANPHVPPETACVLLPKLPRSVRTAAADALARRLVSGRMLDRQLVMLEKIMPLTSPEARNFLAGKLRSPDSGGYEASVRLARLALTARWVPERYPAARVAIIGRGIPAENTDLYLVFGPGDPEARFRRYFAAGGGFPDWERISSLIAAPERTAFIAAAAAALESARRAGHFPADMLVRHHVLLAAADPEHAARHMAAAARYDRRPGEASLWRLDFLTGAERLRLMEQLQRAGRLMPIRKNMFIHQPARKGKEK